MITVILGGLCFFMKESRPSQVLRTLVQKISKAKKFDGLMPGEDCALPTLKQFVKQSLSLPVRLFFTEPINCVASLMGATVYGLVLLFSVSLPSVYEGGFGLDLKQGSLVFLALGVGIVPTFLPRIYGIRLETAQQSKGVLISSEQKLFGVSLQ
jgi:hypothetical protein